MLLKSVVFKENVTMKRFLCRFSQYNWLLLSRKMDIDDPIQKLLQNTGWSCDDLLEKLKQYKQRECTTQQKESVVELEKDPISKTSISNTRNRADEYTNSDGPTLNNDESTAIIPTTSKRVNELDRDFSDTDEEESEVNITHCSIINEIIDDDIFCGDNEEKPKQSVENSIHESGQTDEEEEEVTEVRVIEVNEDDDYFEENSAEKHNSSTYSPKPIEYLQTFPRRASTTLHPYNEADLDDIDSDNEARDNSENIFNNTRNGTLEENSTNPVLKDIVSSSENINVDSSAEHTKIETTSVFDQTKPKLGYSKVNEGDTTTIYKKNCEKVLNSNKEGNNSEDWCKPLDNTSNVLEENVEGEAELNSEITNLEDVRTNLKLQLNSLRTRKKGHFFQQLSTNVIESECKSNKLNIANSELETDLNTSKNSSVSLKQDKSDSLYSQTNEFGIVILSVEGGVQEEKNTEKCIENNKQVVDMANDDSSNTFNLTLDNSLDQSLNVNIPQNNIENEADSCEVLDELRKIIRKQKQNNLISRDNICDAISDPKTKVRDFDFFSGSLNRSFPKLVSESQDTTIYSHLSDNSKSSFTNDETTQNSNKNAPFISNTLEEFLIENSKLNISYNVPKCDAEEGLTNSYREKSPVALKTVDDQKLRKILKKADTVKAKTVAQKRKILEKERIKELKKQKKSITVELNHKEDSKKKILSNNSVKFNKMKHSFVEINNKKIWVKGRKPNICVARINGSLHEKSPARQILPKKKLTLLTQLTKKCNEKIKYLPGPLSKKSRLQVNGHDSWQTETKLLPKITLEVAPRIGYPLLPKIICRLPQHDGVVTASQAEFALSVLKTKGNTGAKEEVFKFPIKYVNNQEKIIVKKQKVAPLTCNIEDEDNKKCIDVVANVVNDLIKYVEIKEIAPTLIKDEKCGYNCSEEKLDEMPVIPDNISSIIKKSHKKKSKVELELLRLNCKVVNVEVEEPSEELCNKPYCQLGCVCKSLKCDGMITYHCQNVGCMLECNCPREKSIEYDKLMLPPGTDILSRDTVSRIEDEAKKDLAKVEREFTQTVIHTNDKTIVVGTGGRHKTRRTTKVPPKYSDYIDSDLEYLEKNVVAKTPENQFSAKCFVNLTRLNLQEIIPYCWFHNLYSCYCEQTSMSPLVEEKYDSLINLTTKKSTKGVSTKPCTEEKNANIDKKSVKVSPKKLKIHNESLNNLDSLSLQSTTESKMMSASGRPIRMNKKLKDFTYFDDYDLHSVKHCARTLGVPTNYKDKRKILLKTRWKLTKEDFINTITEAHKLKAKLFRLTPDTPDADILKNQLVREAFIRPAFFMVSDAIKEVKHKRKQVLQVRSDETQSQSSFNQDLAIQRRKKSAQNIIVKSVFDGEVIVDKTNLDLLQTIGGRALTEGYARLLPWKALMNSFNKREINIWCLANQPHRLFINKSEKIPPKNFVNIRQTKQTTEVIRWILSNKLPSDEEDTSFILIQTKDHYEICGVCKKNLNDAKSSDGAENGNQHSDAEESDQNMLFKHKDLNGIQQVMNVSKERFKLQELVEENLAPFGETSIERSKLYMWAALPEIKDMCKWRMIFLNSDFTYLYFSKVKYSIKYTDLLNIGFKAKQHNCTVILRNSLICNPYDHSAFGIYFDPHYQDRLFIGPYFKQIKGDIGTLRYINKSLVCTESFNKMQGKTDYKCGHWLVERPYNPITSNETIDLTEDNSISNIVKRKRKLDVPPIAKKIRLDTTGSKSINPNIDYIKVLDSVPRRPEEFNRYIITNIPHLGYLGAFQHEDSSEIDVSWPFENKIIRFFNVSSATNFLQCRLSSLLQPIPETFKINIIVLKHIDLQKTKPIDSKVLSGHYFCGEFGYYNVKTVSKEFCVDKIGITREDILRIFVKRTHTLVRQKIEELADVLNISGDKYDVVNVLSKAQKEIESLTEKEKHCVVEKSDLILQKRELALKTFCAISSLPEKERNIESWKFSQILKKRSILFPKTVVEPIEIPDSDEEEHNTSNQVKNSTNQKLEEHNENSGFAEQLTSKLDTNKESQVPTVPFPPYRKLKSILKSNVPSSTIIVSKVEPTGSILKKSPIRKFDQHVEKSSSPQQYLAGVKIVKTSQGKLILVSDNQPAAGKPLQLTSPTGKKLVIKNNQIISVKPISQLRENSFEGDALERVDTTVSCSPPKTIILKKSALMKNSQFLTTDAPSSNEKSLLKNPFFIPLTSNFDNGTSDSTEITNRVNVSTVNELVTAEVLENRNESKNNLRKIRIKRVDTICKELNTNEENLDNLSQSDCLVPMTRVPGTIGNELNTNEKTSKDLESPEKDFEKIKNKVRFSDTAGNELSENEPMLDLDRSGNKLIENPGKVVEGLNTFEHGNLKGPITERKIIGKIRIKDPATICKELMAEKLMIKDDISVIKKRKIDESNITKDHKWNNEGRCKIKRIILQEKKPPDLNIHKKRNYNQIDNSCSTKVAQDNIEGVETQRLETCNIMKECTAGNVDKDVSNSNSNTSNTSVNDHITAVNEKNVTEEIRDTTNVNFLVNAVSETFKNKKECIQIRSANAAALTQVQGAAGHISSGLLLSSENKPMEICFDSGNNNGECISSKIINNNGEGRNIFMDQVDMGTTTNESKLDKIINNNSNKNVEVTSSETLENNVEEHLFNKNAVIINQSVTSSQQGNMVETDNKNTVNDTKDASEIHNNTLIASSQKSQGKHTNKLSPKISSDSVKKTTDTATTHICQEYENGGTSDINVLKENKETQAPTNPQLVDHEALVKICTDAIRKECIKTNTKIVKDISVSVSVTVSAQLGQNSTEKYNGNETPHESQFFLENPKLITNTVKNICTDNLTEKIKKGNFAKHDKRRKQASSRNLKKRRLSILKNKVSNAKRKFRFNLKSKKCERVHSNSKINREISKNVLKLNSTKRGCVNNNVTSKIREEKSNMENIKTITSDERVGTDNLHNITVAPDGNGIQLQNKFPSSKRISNIVVHTVQTPNCPKYHESSKENTDHTNKESHPKFHRPSVLNAQIVSMAKENNTMELEKCPTSFSSSNSVQHSIRHQETNSVKETECSSVATENTIKRVIKCVSAKANNVFSIDKNSFSRYRKKMSDVENKSEGKKYLPVTSNSLNKMQLKLLEKKDIPMSRRGRVRRDMISCKDLAQAGKLLSMENRKNYNFANQICALAESTLKVHTLMVLNKDTFLKNAELADKVINIGNIKKKLQANISEVSNDKSPDLPPRGDHGDV